MAIYRLTKNELLQALADFITKKYEMYEPQAMDMNVQMDARSGNITIEVKPRTEAL